MKGSKHRKHDPTKGQPDEGWESRAHEFVKEQYRRAKYRPLTRHLSLLNFVHWWAEPAFKERAKKLMYAGMSIEKAKAALWYEAARRRPEVQQAWLKGEFSLTANGWQQFTGLVKLNLPLPWPELDCETMTGLVRASYSPLAVPPAGYSIFPETHRSEQQRVSMHVLRLPIENNDGAGAKGFVELARRFEDAGFLILAVDKKSNQAVRYAFEAIQKLPPTFRKADVYLELVHFLPSGISRRDKRIVDQKFSRGTLTEHHLGKVWEKYHKPPAAGSAPSDYRITTVQRCVIHKTRQGKKLVEEKKFKFDDICRQLEAHDAGQPSDFVGRVRL